MDNRRFAWLLGVLACTACDRELPRSAATQSPPPVQCSEYPAERQDVVTCRYVYQFQMSEVWPRSTQLAATSALALGATHIQWLSLETHFETVQGRAPVECSRTWGGIKCDGGAYQMPIGYIAVTRFALLSAAEAAARSTDPLIPAERRPLDARAIASAAPR